MGGTDIVVAGYDGQDFIVVVQKPVFVRPDPSLFVCHGSTGIVGASGFLGSGALNLVDTRVEEPKMGFSSFNFVCQAAECFVG